MKRALLIGAAALVFTSGIALAAPESLLPPGFNRPTPTPAARPVAPVAVPTIVSPQAPAAPSVSSPVVQPLPGVTTGEAGTGGLPANFPSIAEIEKMSPDEIDELLGLKPKFDIPPGARRSLQRVGVISRDEGGFPARAVAGQPGALVRAALDGTRHPLLSRWGHILLRRTLASRLDAPQGMDPVEFAALRAAALNRMGEGYAARALVQDIDSSNYNSALTNAAFDAYLLTGDIVGLCPVARLKGDIRKDGEWKMVQAICRSFAGDGRQGARELDLALSRGTAPAIDVLLAKRYAGAAGEGGQAVNIEWDEVKELNPWRYSLAVTLGLEVPASLRSGAGGWYDRMGAVSPALPLGIRADSADKAAGEGILSSSALVDLYSQIYSTPEVGGDAAQRAGLLREAYVAADPADRMQAMRDLWGGTSPDYGRLVLTAYAAARVSPSKDLEADAPLLISSMLAAGLDRNAMRWASVVPQGSTGWALLALAQPRREGAVSQSAVDSFFDDDGSSGQRKSQFLLAGLAGLGRLESGDARSLAGTLKVNLTRESAWSRMITRAADANNPALVSMLAGLGMQGDKWDMMTARQLYFIVRSLNRVGLSAEARMIAAEAVARG
ncbi:hypothetical protein SZ64_04105 [Erythrobacter sp. SG61-1L]|uniref:hypothetical protein n=1 Tax=Erythrobacter sp. SG61-1L TaxID=1603897 RepID=UPI0006C91B07|nr:hypothetical protein [Erythrobacter sp. SG61-1L]KPL67357.1 hypothetical protein SZ64_04105 [Erythrobacter sp. SG61-1L]